MNGTRTCGWLGRTAVPKRRMLWVDTGLEARCPRRALFRRLPHSLATPAPIPPCSARSAARDQVTAARASERLQRTRGSPGQPSLTDFYESVVIYTEAIPKVRQEGKRAQHGPLFGNSLFNCALARTRASVPLQPCRELSVDREIKSAPQRNKRRKWQVQPLLDSFF
jgi:hypothetical protein